jgi:hypothetical protein
MATAPCLHPQASQVTCDRNTTQLTLEKEGATLQHLLLEVPNDRKSKIGLMLPIRNLENKGINNNTSSLSVLMPKQQKSLVGNVIPRGVKQEVKEEDSKVGIKDKVDIKDKVGSKDNVFPSVNNIQVKAKWTASGGKKSNRGRRKNK